MPPMLGARRITGRMLDLVLWRRSPRCGGHQSKLAVIAADADLGKVPKWRGVGRRPTRPSKVRAGAKAPIEKQWTQTYAEAFRTAIWHEGSQGKPSSRFAAGVCFRHIGFRPASFRRPPAGCWRSRLFSWRGSSKLASAPQGLAAGANRACQSRKPFSVTPTAAASAGNQLPLYRATMHLSSYQGQ